MNRSPARFAALLFFSGFCALVYQTAWLRSLRLVFGASTAATAAVLGIFMAGLGFGGLLLGRRADRSRNPLDLYARLEGGIAIVAALSPVLIDAGRAAYLAVGGTSTLGFAGGTVVRLLISVAILGGPAFLMGGTLPAIARAAESAADGARRRFGLLYGWNTIGAVVGVLATTFWLIELVGVRRSIWLAALLNLLVAVVARASARGAEQREVSLRAAPASLGAPSTPARFVLVAAFAVGFVFLMMELVWYRMLAPLLGGSTYTFGVVLAVALAGIGGGGLLFAVASPARATPRAFAWSCAAEAIALAVPWALGDRVADLAIGLQSFSRWGFGPLVLVWTTVAVVVVFVPALVAGYQFPLLVALLGRGDREVGRQVGAAYASNTLGAITGSLAAGFGLLPLLTAPGLWRLCVLALVVLAGAALAVRRRWSGTTSPALAAAVAVLLVLAPGPTSAWRHRPIGAGRVEIGTDDANALRRNANLARRAITWQAEGREVSVALRSDSGHAFVINGKVDGHSLSDADTQVMSGLVGALLHADPRRAMVIGLGTGSTAGWLAAVPSIERVDVVEIEPAILGVAAACAPVNRNVLANPKVRVRLDDAREVLQTTDERYDLVFSEPSNPYRVGIASLFSREFYLQVKERMSEGGILLQWLQAYEIDPELVRTVYATLGSVFASVETWQVGPFDLLLVATSEPIHHDPERVARRVRSDPYRTAMARTWGVEGAAGFYSGHVAVPEFSGSILASARGWIESDDRPRLEFGFARLLGRTGTFSVQQLRELAASHGGALSTTGWWSDPAALSEALGARMLAEQGRSSTIERFGASDESGRARARARRAWSEGRLADGLAAWRNSSSPPQQPIERTLFAESLAIAGNAVVLDLLPMIEAGSPPEAALIEAAYRLAVGDQPAAARALRHGFGLLRDDPWAFGPLVARSLSRVVRVATAAPAEAAGLLEMLREPLAVRAFDELRRRVVLDLVKRVDFGAGCLEALAPFEPWPPWEERFLIDRLDCHRLHGGTGLERAGADLDEYLAAAPPRIRDWALPASARPDEPPAIVGGD